MKSWADEIYRLLPAVHQIRDGQQHEALRAFLALIGEQTQQIQDDIDQLYDNWFIETSDDWVVPYIGDLVGFRRSGAGGEPADAITPRGQLLNRFLYPRREIANLVRRRRRKGTLSVLETMAKDVSGWPSRAVEFSKRITFFQNVNFPQPALGRTFSLRDKDSFPRLNTPFDTIAHTVDVRTIQSQPGVGWYHPKKVGLFVWRRKVLSATMVGPCRACRNIVPPGATNGKEVKYFTFNRLGIDGPLYVRPVEDTDEFQSAAERNLPVPLYRHLLADENGHAKDEYYGLGNAIPKSLAIYIRRGADSDWSIVSGDKIFVTDLDDAHLQHFYRCLQDDQIAIDPERGRFVFGCKNRPCDVRVTYHYAITAEMGGGEYDRQVIDKPGTTTIRVRNDEFCKDGSRPNLFEAVEKVLSKSTNRGPRCQPASTNAPLRKSASTDTADALAPANAVASECPATWIISEDLCIAIAESDSFQIPACQTLRIERGKTLIIRASRGAWPMLHLHATDSDNCHAPWHVQMGEGSTLVIDGLLVCGVTLQLDPSPPIPDPKPIDPSVASTCRTCDGPSGQPAASPEAPQLHLRHSTFVPGGRADSCLGGGHASIGFHLPQGEVVIRHSIVGTLNVEHSQCSNCREEHPRPDANAATCPLDPVAITISDSIVDAAEGLPAIYSNCCSPAHADLIVERSTILGDLCVQQITRAEDSLFAGIVHVQRRGHGYMRFCYVPTDRDDVPHLSGMAWGCRARSLLHAGSELIDSIVRSHVFDVSGADWCHVVRTPARFKCVPEPKRTPLKADPVSAGAEPAGSDGQNCSSGCNGSSSENLAKSRERVSPRFVSTDYGQPGYCELDIECSTEITQGSEDQSEVGVFHDLYRPQREAALRSRLQEYTPADMQSAVLYADDLHPANFGRQRY